MEQLACSSTRLLYDILENWLSPVAKCSGNVTLGSMQNGIKYPLFQRYSQGNLLPYNRVPVDTIHTISYRGGTQMLPAYGLSRTPHLGWRIKAARVRLSCIVRVSGILT